MYGYCYIFSIQFYITKLTYRVYTVQLEGNLNVKHIIWSWFYTSFLREPVKILDYEMISFCFLKHPLHVKHIQLLSV